MPQQKKIALQGLLFSMLLFFLREILFFTFFIFFIFLFFSTIYHTRTDSARGNHSRYEGYEGSNRDPETLGFPH